MGLVPSRWSEQGARDAARQERPGERAGSRPRGVGAEEPLQAARSTRARESGLRPPQFAPESSRVAPPADLPRMKGPRSILVAVAELAALACPAAAQHLTGPPARQTAKQPAIPEHRPHLSCKPLVALDHLRSGNQLFRRALARHEPPPLSPERPSGAGRYVAAVLVCADAGIDAPHLFSLDSRDCLLLSNAGPCVSPEDVALLERAVDEEHLSLIVILTHDDCASLASSEHGSPSRMSLARRTRSARDMARARGIPVAEAAARLEAEILCASSERLLERVRSGDLLVAPAVASPRDGAIRWLLTRAEEMPMPPVK
ncbi:MAG: hypothetical protein Fur0037_09930 [Planctomycetota bacterium]